MNEQQILDFVAPKLIAQGMPSKEGEGCKYRGPNGLKCAIGFLIEDDELAIKMDRIGPFETKSTSISHYITSKEVELPSYFYEIDSKFFTKLQGLHDFSTWNDIRKDLVDFANYYNLKVNF